MVSNSNAVVEPEAVTVVSLHTFVANVAMLGSGSLKDFAFRTNVFGVNVLEHGDIGYLRIGFNISRLFDE